MGILSFVFLTICNSVNDAIIFYYNKINHGAKAKFKNVGDEEYNLIMDEIENYICKRLYSKYIISPFDLLKL